MNAAITQGIDLFATMPPSYGRQDAGAYLEDVRRISRWSDEAGYKGILVYTDNATVDPWLAAQVIIENTRSLMPLVAVQPVYMHPYTVAKMVSTLSFFYGRQIALNMVAGGFMNDLSAMGDKTPHDRRYNRLTEYTTIIQRLLACPAPVTFDGEFYSVHQLSLKPALPAGLFPFVTISGSSTAGIAAARELNAVPVKYPEPAGDCRVEGVDSGYGIRVGIVARADRDEAWRVARDRFPPDRAGRLTRTLASKVSDSQWHKQLSNLAAAPGADGTYWLEPFEQYKTNCPYLVGSYQEVAAEIGRYASAGCKLVILDVPASEEEFEHTTAVFSRVCRKASA